MKNPPLVRLTAAFVGVAVLAIAVFAAFYILGALTALIVCAAVGVCLIAFAAIASAKIAHYRQTRALARAEPQTDGRRV